VDDLLFFLPSVCMRGTQIWAGYVSQQNFSAKLYETVVRNRPVHMYVWMDGWMDGWLPA
jgi:hypothetical protein